MAPPCQLDISDDNLIDWKALLQLQEIDYFAQNPIPALLRFL